MTGNPEFSFQILETESDGGFTTAAFRSAIGEYRRYDKRRNKREDENFFHFSFLLFVMMNYYQSG
jgi:cation transport regulator ChaB